MHAGSALHFAFQCGRDVNASQPPLVAIRMDKMSKTAESGSCPDGYRALSTDELRELLQKDTKMDQIIGLNEKVRTAPLPHGTKVLRGICAF